MSWCQHDDLTVYEYEKQSGDCAPDRRVFFCVIQCMSMTWWPESIKPPSVSQMMCFAISLAWHFHDNQTLKCLKMSEFQRINSRYSLLLTSEPGSWKTPVKFQWHLTRQNLYGWVIWRCPWPSSLKEGSI